MTQHLRNGGFVDSISLSARINSSSGLFVSNNEIPSAPHPHNVILLCTGDALLITCYNIFICCLLTMNWIICYREKWMFYSLKERWQSIIRRATSSENWFIVNNQRYGNKLFMCKVFGTYHLFSCTSSIVGIVCQHLGLLSRSVTALMSALPLALSTCSYVAINVQTIRMYLITDNWFVHWERELIGKLLMVFIILYAAEQVIIAVFADIDDLFCSLIFAPFFVIVTFAIHYVSTYGIFWKNNSFEEKTKRRDIVSVDRQLPTADLGGSAANLHVNSQRETTPSSGTTTRGPVELTQLTWQKKDDTLSVAAKNSKSPLKNARESPCKTHG